VLTAGVLTTVLVVTIGMLTVEVVVVVTFLAGGVTLMMDVSTRAGSVTIVCKRGVDMTV